MKVKPFIAHSELTNEIYIVSGREKYLVTEQAVKAVKAIKALEQEPRKGHWEISYSYDGRGIPQLKCSNCHEELHNGGNNYCPNCGADMREVEE